MINFVCWVLIVALVVKFILTVAEKWGILEWMQAHAPFELLYKMLSCEFCRSFWLGVVICSILAVILRDCSFLFIPILSCNIR